MYAVPREASEIRSELDQCLPTSVLRRNHTFQRSSEPLRSSMYQTRKSPAFPPMAAGNAALACMGEMRVRALQLSPPSREWRA